MARLEELTHGATVGGILPDGVVTVLQVQRLGSAALELTYKTPDGKVANQLLRQLDSAGRDRERFRARFKDAIILLSPYQRQREHSPGPGTWRSSAGGVIG